MSDTNILFDIPEQDKHEVREVGNPANVVMVGLQVYCAEYCEASNNIMIEFGESARFEVVPTSVFVV